MQTPQIALSGIYVERQNNNNRKVDGKGGRYSSNDNFNSTNPNNFGDCWSGIDYKRYHKMA